MTPTITWPTDHSSHTHTDKDKDKDKDKDNNKDNNKHKDKDEVDHFQPIKANILWKLRTLTFTWPTDKVDKVNKDKVDRTQKNHYEQHCFVSLCFLFLHLII